ncbi:MAG: hypothetical protein RLZZ283_281 [Candidatus Parcubacteria bacterium]|jgi:hypothetical protein
MSEKRGRKRPKTIVELKMEFLKLHWRCAEVDNPRGRESGEFSKRWNKRGQALDALVRAKAKD